MSRKQALIFSLSAVLVFSAAVLLLRFPWRVWKSVEISARAASEEATLTGGDGEQTALELLPDEKLNINTATAEELTKLPGIGAVLSQAIVEYREKNGNFSTIEDIMKVSGIGEGRFAAIEEYIYVEG